VPKRLVDPMMVALRRRWSRRLAVVGVGLPVLLVACSSGSSTGSSSAPPAVAIAAPSPRPLSAATQARLQGLANQFLDTTKAPGLLAAVWTPQGTWITATGVGDLATGAPLTTDMQFRIGSQTKAFVGDLVLQLVGEGKVSLDDRIAKWVPGVPNGNQITIRQLLNHTGGLGDLAFGSDPDVAVPSSYAKVNAGCTIADVLAPTPPVAAPGTKWAYSNYGYELLGRVAELAGGDSLSNLIRQRITQPLGLKRTYLPTSGSGLTTPYAHGFSVSPEQPSAAPTDVSSLGSASCLWAAGGMVSTLSDLRVWSVALGTGKLLKPSVWAEAQQNRVPLPGGGPFLGNVTYGLGFIETGGFIGHPGNWIGYDSATYYSPALHTTVSIFDNGMASGNGETVSWTGLAQELTMAALGRTLDFGFTPGQGIAPLPPPKAQAQQSQEA
jgi:D-alanyl-D-alanine carboxypeptidase